KRGPKTDVLEALLKRVDGLERRLKEEKKSHSPTEPALDAAESSTNSGESKPIPLQQEGTNPAVEEDVLFSRPPISEPSPSVLPDDLLDTYFARCHGKPYYILDESSARQRIQLGQMPGFLLYAIYAVSAR
ncbi:hypothetical protein DH86_00001378, partial [Scytalidium sp. 3C]